MKLVILFLISFAANSNDLGKKVYTSKCIKCHNTNPTKPGTIGPDIADSTLTLITLKTQHRKYPDGYKPKRKTKIMPKIPLNDTELMGLYEYISSFNKGKK